MSLSNASIICPECKVPLNGTELGCTCPACKRCYRSRNGVLALLPENIATPTREDILAWNDRDSGRVEHQAAWLALLGKEAEIRQFRDHLLKIFTTGTILEVGGGSCWGSMLIKHEYPDSYVVATDAAASALTKARELARLADSEADRYVACDINRLPFPDEHFDFCFGSEVLHHLADPVAGLKEIRRVLKTGGTYLGMGEGFATKPMQWMLNKFGLDRSREAAKYEMMENVYSYRQWTEFFRSAGFRNVRFELSKDPSYQYRERIKLMYYLVLSFLPDIIIQKSLGMAMVIKAN